MATDALARPFRCPFCKRRCEIGWDCKCGACAIHPVCWLDPGRPLMRRRKTPLDAVVLTTATKKLQPGIREMWVLKSEDQ